MLRSAAGAALLTIVSALIVGTRATSLRPTKSFGGRVAAMKTAATQPDILYRNGWVMGDASVVIIWCVFEIPHYRTIGLVHWTARRSQHRARSSRADAHPGAASHPSCTDCSLTGTGAPAAGTAAGLPPAASTLHRRCHQ
jgi:hypothetical protein